CPFRDELESRDPLLKLSGVVDAPAKLHSQPAYRRTELRQSQAQPAMGVKRHLAALKMVGESLEQVLHLLVRQVHQEPLGNDYRRLVAAYLIQKAGVGNIRSDQAIPLAWWVEAPAELDHLGI